MNDNNYQTANRQRTCFARDLRKSVNVRVRYSTGSRFDPTSGFSTHGVVEYVYAIRSRTHANTAEFETYVVRKPRRQR